MVEWKELKEVFDTRNGYTPSTSNDAFWEEGNIPWFKMEDIRDNGNILNDSYLHITDKAIKGKGLFKANSILLATSATIGEHALIEVEHLSNQRFTNFYPKKEYEQLINMRYAYYYMFIIDNWCKQHVNQGGFASVDMGGLYKYPFPIPSLEEQTRIVGILDTFTSSIDNLKEQIAQRRKQYEFYRDQLINKSFSLFSNIYLKDVAIIKNGKDYKELGIGDIPVYGSGGIMTYVDTYASDSPSVLLPRKGSVENIFYVEKPFWTVDTIYWTDIDCTRIIPKYLFYALSIYNLKDYAYGGARPSLSQPILYKLRIPLPPLQEQQRIVSILDTFEASIRNLEAQLSQREKQYEYYRNKLLTFE